MKFTSSIAVILCLTTSAVFADGHHIKERQDVMKGISGQLRVIGGMAQGRVDFDADKAAAAKIALVDYASSIETVFADDENGPSSEAKPEIWSDWDGFLVKANALVDSASALKTASVADLGAGMGAIGGACSSCHKAFRAKK